MALVLIGFAIVAIAELLPLVKRKSKKGVTAFLVIFGCALIMALLAASKIKMASLVEIICDFMERIGLAYPE